mmetsp:Transcript_24698/g.37610  ORF Transcript_24698/g.37610 Transcript_24698/m.37610 type:complete len:206 (+) Transcript_24698:963-1580(+)
MEQNLLLPTKRPNLLHGLPRPNLVIHRHHAHQQRILPHGTLQLFHIDQSGAFQHRQVRHIESLLFQKSTRVQNALMFRLSRNHVLLILSTALHPVKVSGALDAQIIALGRPRRENDFLRRRTDQRGYPTPRLLDDRLALPSVGMGAGVGIPVRSDHVGHHLVEDAGVHGCGGGGVEVGCHSLAEGSSDGVSAVVGIVFGYGCGGG